MRIAFSGASHSGKTTAIENIKKLYPDFKVLNEVIRDRNLNIDEIRTRPNDYFDLQLQIIKQKIDQEIDHRHEKNLLIDRTLCDSLYYYTRYIDINKLSPKNVRKYYTFMFQLIEHIKYAGDVVYDKVIIMRPIIFNNLSDHFRPKNLKDIQQSEFQSISLICHKLLDSDILYVTNAKELENEYNMEEGFFGFTK